MLVMVVYMMIPETKRAERDRSILTTTFGMPSASTRKSESSNKRSPFLVRRLLDRELCEWNWAVMSGSGDTSRVKRAGVIVMIKLRSVKGQRKAGFKYTGMEAFGQ